jgi:hypothetical protein
LEEPTWILDRSKPGNLSAKTQREISAKLPAIVAASRQTAAFPNEITNAALCRGAATPALQGFHQGLKVGGGINRMPGGLHKSLLKSPA